MGDTVDEIVGELRGGQSVVAVRGEQGESRAGFVRLLVPVLQAHGIQPMLVQGRSARPLQLHRAIADMLGVGASADPGQLVAGLRMRPASVPLVLLIDGAEAVSATSYQYVTLLCDTASRLGARLPLILVGDPGAWPGLGGPECDGLRGASSGGHLLAGREGWTALTGGPAQPSGLFGRLPGHGWQWLAASVAIVAVTAGVAIVWPAPSSQVAPVAPASLPAPIAIPEPKLVDPPVKPAPQVEASRPPEPPEEAARPPDGPAEPSQPVVPHEEASRALAVESQPPHADQPVMPSSDRGGAGLVLMASAGDSLEAMYRQVYRGMRPPSFAEVTAANQLPLRAGALVVFPEPPGGWQRR